MALRHASALQAPFAVARWSAWPLSVPLPRPYRSAKGTLQAIPMLHTEIRTDAGAVGHGVVFVPSVALLKGALSVAQGLQSELGSAKRTAFDHTGLIRRRLGAWCHEGVAACVAAALELALVDAVSQQSGLPLPSLFGSAPVTLATYGGVGLGDLAQTVQEAGRLVLAGHRALKFKLGHETLEQDLAVLQAVRQEHGHGLKLMVDYNQSLSVSEAIRRGHALEPLSLVWMEEPVGAADLEGHAAVAAALGGCLQSGENWWTVAQVRRAIELKASDAVMLDPAKLGVAGWLAAAEAVADARMAVSSHLSPHVCAQLLSTTDGSGWLEWTDWWAPFVGPVPVREGRVACPDAPVGWDEAALASHRMS